MDLQNQAVAALRNGEAPGYSSKSIMDFISNKELQIKEMLKVIGVPNIDALFDAVPKRLKLPKPELDDGLCEFEGLKHMEALAQKNTFASFDNYLGAGAYEHHVPALVSAICSRSEFLTAYTPYQAEASQGLLQAIFEFQTAVCALTGLDVANASLYDGASACAEALLMALRIKKERNKVAVSNSLHPHYRAVIKQYLGDIQICKPGEIDEETAAVLLPYPNFFGIVDEIKPVFKRAKEAGALSIVCANPIIYGLFASAKELGADIAVGDMQPLGHALQFGGPYIGYLACKKELLRQVPGRIVGETVDTQGKKGYVLTLQAREQHIRREKATSNICTNQTLAALASLITLLWYGKEGLKKLALINYQKANYLKNGLEALPGIEPFSNAPIFNEFVIGFPTQVKEAFRKAHIEPGLDLERYFPKMKNCLLIAVTETKSQEQLDRYIQVAKEVL